MRSSCGDSAPRRHTRQLGLLVVPLLLLLAGCSGPDATPATTTQAGPTSAPTAMPERTAGPTSSTTTNAPASTPATTATSAAPSKPAAPIATTSPGNRQVRLPPAAGRADYQLGEAYPPPAGTQIVTRDRTARPAAGAYGICYVNAFQTQPEQTRWWRRVHPDLLLRDAQGREVGDPDWPGEVLLDTRTASARGTVAQVVGTWIEGCAAQGYDAVEPDNLDSWTRSRGLLRPQDAEDLSRLLATRAHRHGLAIAQKNAPELAPIGSRIGFDFAVAEECGVYDECAAYTGAYGRRVIEVEYTDNGRQAYAQACRLRAGQLSILLRDRDLTAPGSGAYTYESC